MIASVESVPRQQSRDETSRTVRHGATMSSDRSKSTHLDIDSPPRDPDGLRRWISGFTGVEIARTKVCPGHHAPWDYFCELYFQRPALILALGSRGAGKSFLSALHTHLTSRFHPKHGTRVLGGSLAQSMQVYRALRELVQGGGGKLGSDEKSLEFLLKEEARYHNGSEISILSASSTSVRGPHVPSLKLDEVDEIDPEIREAAVGMCMKRHGAGPSIVMTSTWHRVGGPMSVLIDQARDGAFPFYTFCAFEVLERCPDERSGPNLEHCGTCPIKFYCHDVPDGGPPKAKRSSGHYSIDSLIQKMRITSRRTFEADYLCLGPRADGTWFSGFDSSLHVSERAEYDPAFPVHLAVDTGVFTGAVFFQVVPVRVANGPAVEEVRVFADYLAEDISAEANARALLEQARRLCQGRTDRITTDPAGQSRTTFAVTVISEYERAGLRPMRTWPMGSVADGLVLIESFLNPAAGHSHLFIHPRCGPMIRAFQGYRRAKRGGQWQDYPEDPQHPDEDLMDALRGGLRAHFPEGRARPAPVFKRLPARSVL